MALGNSWHYSWPLHDSHKVQKGRCTEQHTQSVTNIYEYKKRLLKNTVKIQFWKYPCTDFLGKGESGISKKGSPNLSKLICSPKVLDKLNFSFGFSQLPEESEIAGK